MAVTHAYSGSFPWSKQRKRADEAAGWQWNAGIGTKRVGRSKNSPTVQYPTGGWTMFNKDVYDQHVKKNGLYQFRLYNGRKSWVPGGDVDEHIGFRTLSNDEINEEIANDIDKAFAKSDGKGRYYEFDGAGHIAHVRYNPSMQIMEVSFVNRGDTVTFFRVPREVMLTLEYSVDKMGLGVDGKMRHLIGIQFWNLVRIRGTRRGVRYPSVGSTAANAALGVDLLRVPDTIDPSAEQFVAAEKEAIDKAHPSNSQVELEKRRDALWDRIDRKFHSQGNLMDEAEEQFGAINKATEQDIQNLESWMRRKGIL